MPCELGGGGVYAGFDCCGGLGFDLSLVWVFCGKLGVCFLLRG